MRDLTLNRLRDSEKSKILRDLNTTLEAGFAIILARDAVLRKKMVFGIEMTEFRDVGLSWKQDQIPPAPPPPKHPPRPCSNDRCSSKARSGHIYFMEDNLQHAVSKLRYMCSSRRGGRL